MSISFFVRGAPLRSSTDAPRSSSKASTIAWSTRLSTMLRVDRAPDTLNLPISMVVTKPATSIARNKFDLQILYARLCETANAQNSHERHAAIGIQNQHAFSC